jgi:hypothetical protein
MVILALPAYLSPSQTRILVDFENPAKFSGYGNGNGYGNGYG